VVRAGHDDAPNAFLQGGPIDVVGERDVLVLRPELGIAVVLPRGGVESRRAHVPTVDDGVGAAEVLAVLVAIRSPEIGAHNARVARVGPPGDAPRGPPL